MRLATFGDDRVGVVDNDSIIDVSHLVEDNRGRSRMRSLITRFPDGIPASALAGDLERTSLTDLVLGPPVPDPTKIIAAPINYHDHQSEMRQGSHVSALGFFLKAPSSVLRPGGTVVLPYADRRFDQEGELACIVGRTARRVSPEDALDYVFGYTGLLDITMRGGEDRSTRKSFESFTPLGPWIVTKDEFGSPDDVSLQCWVSNELRQDANTRDLIWDVAQFVSYASWVTTLNPGDVITTGTPAGVNTLHDGDTIELELSGIGARLHVTVDGTTTDLSPTSGFDAGPVPPPPTRCRPA